MPEHCGCLHEMETWRALQPVESCRMGREEGGEGRQGDEGEEPFLGLLPTQPFHLKY